MIKKPTQVLLAFALWSAAAAAAPTVVPAQQWLSQVPPLPATAEAAYTQWSDISGVLTPNAVSQKISAGISAEVLSLARAVEPPPGASGGLNAHDKPLVEKIAVFSDTDGLLRKVKAAQADQAALLQTWHAELNSLEQRRLQARSALPACHNEAGTPSQASIRDVEQRFATERIEVAVRYLAQFQPRLEQLLAAVAPRIAHGDAVMSAWSKLGNPFKRAELAPVAHGAESDALQDVALIQSYIQEVSKLAARSISERNAVQRVYADARGC